MELINENLIEINVDLDNKDEVITEVARLLSKDGRLSDASKFIDDIYIREEELSTSMDFGIAIPHTQSESVKSPSLVFLKLAHNIQWNTDDNVRLIFGIAVTKGDGIQDHLKILSIIARKLMNDDFRERLLSVKDKKECMELLRF